MFFDIQMYLCIIPIFCHNPLYIDVTQLANQYANFNVFLIWKFYISFDQRRYTPDYIITS